MPSIVPGYEYDIFISYRHNDNRSGWVTEFVRHLDEELRATIKEPVSVYFDCNAYDGLLETHNVDKSLERKLNCLVFIPILSQTYCDPGSFAWQNEFLCFSKSMKEDSFGADVQLSNGNVSARLLPVRIHEIDTEDKTMLEKVLGYPVRPIDFIFTSTGVNRPLTPADARNENSHRIFYRDQINKTANAIKDIITALKNGNVKNSGVRLNPEADNQQQFERSIAVLPFANMSSDPEQEFFGDGIAEDIINSLVHLKNLKVAGRTSSFQFKGKNPDLREVGERLGVKTVLEGSIRKQGNRLRITAQLINAEDGFHLWSEQYNRTLDDVFAIQDEIALTITEKLQVTLLADDKVKMTKSYTENPEAYLFYLKGRFFLNRRLLWEGLEQFEKAVSVDPLYARAYAGIADASILLANYGFSPPKEIMPKAKVAAEKALQLDGTLCEPYCSLGLYYASFEWRWREAKSNFLRSIELNPTYTQAYIWYGHYYLAWVEGKVDEGERFLRKAIKLEPLSAIGYLTLYGILSTDGRFEEGLEIAKEGFALDPDSYVSQRVMGLAYLDSNQYEQAAEHLEKASALVKRAPMSLLDLVYVYVRQGSVEKARQVMKELMHNSRESKYTSPFILGIAQAHLGDYEEAFHWLDKAYAGHDGFLCMMRNYPWMPYKLKDDERFNLLVKKLNFPV
jgi:adenylate cyclase